MCLNELVSILGMMLINAEFYMSDKDVKPMNATFNPMDNEQGILDKA